MSDLEIKESSRRKMSSMLVDEKKNVFFVPLFWIKLVLDTVTDFSLAKTKQSVQLKSNYCLNL